MKKIKKIEEILEKLKSLGEEDSEYATSLQEHISKLNDENKKHRLGKKTYKEALDEIAKEYGVDKPEEVIERATGSSNEIKKLMDDIATLQEDSKNDKDEAKKARLDSKVTSAMAKKKIKKNFDFTKKALLGMVEEGESGLLVGDKGLDDYLQSMIDEDQTVVDSKTKKETKTGSADVYTESELKNLTEKETEANMDKVNRSLEALG